MLSLKNSFSSSAKRPGKVVRFVRSLSRSLLACSQFLISSEPLSLAHCDMAPKIKVVSLLAQELLCTGLLNSGRRVHPTLTGHVSARQ